MYFNIIFRLDVSVAVALIWFTRNSNVLYDGAFFTATPVYHVHLVVVLGCKTIMVLHVLSVWLICLMI